MSCNQVAACPIVRLYTIFHKRSAFDRERLCSAVRQYDYYCWRSYFYIHRMRITGEVCGSSNCGPAREKAAMKGGG